MNIWKKLKFLLKYGSFNPKRIDGVDHETWLNINIGRDGLFLKANPDRVVFEMYLQACCMKHEKLQYINHKLSTYTAVEMAIRATTLLYGDDFKQLLMDAWERRKKILDTCQEINTVNSKN